MHLVIDSEQPTDPNEVSIEFYGVEPARLGFPPRRPPPTYSAASVRENDARAHFSYMDGSIPDSHTASGTWPASSGTNRRSRSPSTSRDGGIEGPFMTGLRPTVGSTSRSLTMSNESMAGTRI